MEFAYTRELSEEEKEKINSWLSETLLKVVGESDEVLMEYVMVMILNSKTMGEISDDLEAFVGTPTNSEFALR